MKLRNVTDSRRLLRHSPGFSYVLFIKTFKPNQGPVIRKMLGLAEDNDVLNL
jgi:hypothetical protein